MLKVARVDTGSRGRKDDDVCAGDKSPAYFKTEFFRSLFSAVTELRDLVTPTWLPPARNFSALKFDAELDMRLL
jgi:hypothetical protein